jgi:hypothetical protein
VLGNSTTKIHIGKGVSLFPFQSLHWSFLETIAGFLKLVELCKGLVVSPCLASSEEVYGIHDPLADG